MIPYLSRFYRVVTPDLRGLGESSRDFDLETGLSVENYVSDLIAIADDIGAETFHYAAESLGGIIGMVLAADHPARVRTLSLLAAPLSISPWTQKTFALDHPTWQDALRIMGSRAWSAAVGNATRFPPGSDPKMLEWYANETGKSDVNVLIAMSRLAARADATPVLTRIRAPVLGLYPSGGPITSDHEAILKAQVASIRIVHVPTTYHMIWVPSQPPARTTSCISWPCTTAQYAGNDSDAHARLLPVRRGLGPRLATRRSPGVFIGDAGSLTTQRPWSRPVRVCLDPRAAGPVRSARGLLYAALCAARAGMNLLEIRPPNVSYVK
jgi:3-oxoadipate enol-lactonase